MSIRVGLIGAGSISETHARAAQAIPGVEIVAVHGGNPERAARLAAVCGAAACPDLESFFAYPMDIAIIGSPSGLHAQQGIEAASRGVHVLVEKPIDGNVERADALIAAARSARVKLGVLFQDRGRPSFVRLRAALAEGRLGRPLLASARVKWFRPPDYYSQSKWRGTWALDGGGALMNQGIHTVDLLLWLLGPVRRLSARTATQHHAVEVEDTALAWLEFENGALATFEATTAAYPGYPRRVELTTEVGTFVIEHDRVIATDTIQPFDEFAAPDAGDANASASSPVVSDAGAHQRMIEDFIQAIREDRDPCCPGTEARRSLVVAKAMYESSRTGRIVEVGT
ncbi:MAG TPA: Gfo/Idh/MocA family oxidoreductase [Vicinamibacterales bacterium]|nr:Gfo/Idh/MocA family oxidoreductase [Vicinamibacterales bacterium]